jgi:hypothetical protein
MKPFQNGDYIELEESEKALMQQLLGLMMRRSS